MLDFIIVSNFSANWHNPLLHYLSLLVIDIIVLQGNIFEVTVWLRLPIGNSPPLLVMFVLKWQAQGWSKIIPYHPLISHSLLTLPILNFTDSWMRRSWHTDIGREGCMRCYSLSSLIGWLKCVLVMMEIELGRCWCLMNWWIVVHYGVVNIVGWIDFNLIWGIGVDLHLGN